MSHCLFGNMQALAPKLESMEAAWVALHTLTGADTPREIISFLEGAFAAGSCTQIWLAVHTHDDCSVAQENLACIRLASALGALQTQEQGSLATWATCTLGQPVP